jgi:hypothetical protein
VILKAVAEGLQVPFTKLRNFCGVESSSWRARNVLSTSEPEEQCVTIVLL